MKIGVAIPCYFGHLHYLPRILDSIENQTRKPDAVVVSTSSMRDISLSLNDYKYSFHLEFLSHSDKRNASQNRNSAAKRLKELDMDIVSFMDVDDVMHPQRIEYNEKALLEGCDIVFHDFIEANNSKEDFFLYSDCEIFHNNITKIPHGFGACFKSKIEKYPNAKIHNSQPTMKLEIWENTKYDERTQYCMLEDSVFNSCVLSNSNIKTGYLPYFLSKYYQSSSGSGR